jgi:hypothetical protein
METGEFGVVGLPVQELVGEELRLAVDFVIILHLQMGEQHVPDPTQNHLLVTPPLVEQASLYFQ